MTTHDAHIADRLADYTARASELDAANPLREARDAFDLPQDQVYFLGNSLGPLTHAARRAVRNAVDTEWRVGLVRTWHDGDWLELAAATGDRIARVIGADPGSVIAGDSTSVALFKVLSAAAARNASSTRRVLLCDADNFPTDRYVARSVADLHGLAFEELPVSEMAARFGPDVAVMTASMIDFRSADVHDVKTVTAAAHAAGALTVWDLAHAAGAVKCDVAANAVDFAVGCGYKYLNGGPGAPAFMYVAPHLVNEVTQPIPGWFGHAEPFAFEDAYRPADGIARFASGTTHVLSMKSLHAALELFDRFGIDDIRSTCTGLGDFFVEGFDAFLSDSGFALGSHRDAARRGGHVALLHPQAEEMTTTLIEKGHIVDFRPPNVIRVAFSPLYLRFVDVASLVSLLAGLRRG
jgi:kynureninase